MADSDDLDLEGGDAPEAGGAPKKKGGLGSLLPTILKFVAIGIGALVFIVTVSIITYNIMNKGGKSQTSTSDPSSPYIGKQPTYAYFTLIGSVTTKTKDFPTSNTVTVEMIIGYDQNDQAGAVELTNRQYELRDFVRRYFAQKTSEELTPEREEEIKKEIREQLNTRFLDTARVRKILFNKLDVMEAY